MTARRAVQLVVALFLVAIAFVVRSSSIQSAVAQQPAPAAAPATDSAGIAAEIEQLSRRYSDALENENVAALDSLIAADAWFIRPTAGRQSKADFLASFKNGLVVGKHDVKKVIVHVHGDDVAVAVAQQSLTVTSDPKTKPGNTSGTIWYKRDGKWQVVLRAITEVSGGAK